MLMFSANGETMPGMTGAANLQVNVWAATGVQVAQNAIGT
jgi:hypothetical protein